MRNLRRRTIAFTVALAAAFPAVAPAAAADPVPWQMAPCATAGLAETELDADGQWLVTSGAAVQCAPVAERGGVRLATYPAGASTGTAPGYNVRVFRSAEPGAVRYFGAAVARRGPGEFGVCVLAGDEVRIACVRVTASATGSSLSVRAQPLDPADPLVAKPVVTSEYAGTVFPPTRPGGPVGVCGSCF